MPGKSTALNVAAGLEIASRGAVSLNGRDITYTTPEQRSRLGIHLLPGGKGVFGPMTVAENLEMGGFVYRSDRAELRRRTERVYELFPAIKDRRGERADSLSGGQQQMLALAIAMLHDPAVLMIDELSLGLAPIIVQELIEVVDGLKAAGETLIIVEQSLNVAAAIADRAVFLEKGRVRFEGQIRDLMERDDLARAVFLGRPGRHGMMLAVSWLNSQIVFDGIVQGLAISVIAVGVVLVYRATRIINFAVGNMGVVGAAILSLLVVQYHVPFWVGFAVALVVGLAFGAIVDLAIIRRLRKSPRVVVLVATIGVSQLAAAIAIKIPAPTELTVHFPERHQRHVDGGGRHRPRFGCLGPHHRPDHARRLDVVPRPDDDRPHRQGLREQSAARPLVEHQPQDGLHLGVGPGRRAVHALGRPDRRPERCGR